MERLPRAGPTAARGCLPSAATLTRPDERLESNQDVAIQIDTTRVRWLDAERETALVHDTEIGPGAGLGPVTEQEREAGSAPTP